MDIEIWSLDVKVRAFLLLGQRVCRSVESSYFGSFLRNHARVKYVMFRYCDDVVLILF